MRLKHMAITRTCHGRINYVHTHMDKPDLVEDAKQLEGPVDVCDLSR